MTIAIDRRRWRTPNSGHGKLSVLFNQEGCGCIMGLIAEHYGFTAEDLCGESALEPAALKTIGIDADTQEAAITINDSAWLTMVKRETRLRELFAKHGIQLEFVL